MGRIPPADLRAVAFLALVSAAIQLPFLDRGLSPIDEGSMLAIADALRGGDVLYRDRATFISPLMYEWMALLLDAFGPRLAVGRWFQLAVFSGTALAVYGVLRAFGSRRLALLAALSVCALKPLALPLWTIPNYNQLAVLLALVALGAVLLQLRAPGPGRLAAAGTAIGLCVLTKLSLGAGAALACAASVGLAAWQRSPGPSRVLRDLALLTAAACLPVAAMLGYYAAQGALGALFDRTLLALGGVGSEMRVPLPSPWPWRGDGDEIFRLQYEYYPPPLFTWMLLREFDLYATPLGRVCEALVKLAYYGPLLATAAGFAIAFRELRGGRGEAACRWLLIAGFSALAYGSTAHRLDLAHVLSIAPAPLIVCAAEVARLRRGRARVGAVLLCAWALAGGLAAAAVFDTHDTPLETPRGRLRASHQEVSDAAALLAFLEQTPREERVLLMRTLPLFYFLADRPIVSPFDLFLPAYLRPGEDERFADRLRQVDAVVYNPNELLGIPSPITEFAPRTARALADGFEVSRQLAPTLLLLEPRAGGPERRPVVAEIAREPERVGTGARAGRVEHTSWLVYPVVTTRLLRGDRAVCMQYPHRVAAGEVLSVRPMFEHLAWTDRHWPDAARRVIASVHLRAGGVDTPLFVEERRAGPPGPPLELSLEAWAGRSALLRFCAQRPRGDSEARGIASFGWADPRILAGAATRPRAHQTTPGFSM